MTETTLQLRLSAISGHQPPLREEGLFATATPGGTGLGRIKLADQPCATVRLALSRAPGARFEIAPIASFGALLRNSCSWGELVGALARLFEFEAPRVFTRGLLAGLNPGVRRIKRNKTGHGSKNHYSEHCSKQRCERFHCHYSLFADPTRVAIAFIVFRRAWRADRARRSFQPCTERIVYAPVSLISDMQTFASDLDIAGTTNVGTSRFQARLGFRV